MPPPSRASSSGERLWRAAAYLLCLMIAFALSVSIFQTPFQVSDNIENIWIIYSKSWGELFDYTLNYGQVRPMLWATIKVIYQLSQGQVFLTFKLFHCLQVFLAFFLLCRLLEVRSFLQFLGTAVALVVFVGIHTFSEPVTQAFPVNSLMTIILCCLIAFNLLKSSGGWLVDAAAVVTFFVALFTLETGALVGFILVCGYALGYRGVSPRALGALGLVAALYLVAALHIIDGVASSSRGIGFGLTTKSPEEIARILGDNRYLLYGHNVVVAALSVLFSEPRNGIWAATNRALHGGIQPWMLIQVSSSVLLTGVILWTAGTRLRAWCALAFTEYDRLLIMFLLVLAGNAAICFAYSYDAVLGPAGAFYAIAAFAAFGILFDPAGRRPFRLLTLAIIAPLLLATTLGWSVRAAGLHYQMRVMAWKTQQDWPTAVEHLETGSVDFSDQAFKRFVLETQRQSLEMPVGHSFFWARGLNGYFEE